ncbi:Maf family protein, partial [Streptococcus suis]
DMDFVTGHLYISADTIVVSYGQIFNKPQDLTEAETMLSSYFGKSHHVVTSVCLRKIHSLDVFYTVSQIDFVDYYSDLEE